VADSYVAPVGRADAVAVLLPVDPRAPAEMLERIDGLLLIGGADVDPASYGEQREPSTEATYVARDEFEIAMLRGALERELPVLAICRGMQILNVTLGGTLQQDLVNADGGHPHRKLVGTFEGNEHVVMLEPGSLAARSAGEEVHVGRCHHHQAIKDLGEGLIITGRADDGVTEAIETIDGRWVLGVQWHPEHLTKDSEPARRLFAALVAAAGS
jgi:putative glutamine amidotransferase